MSEDPAVEIKNLVKDFKLPFGKGAKMLRAVDDVSITIGRGQVYGLIGPNGCGKSTTMKALLGLLSPTSGSCSVFGFDSLKVDSRKDIGFLPENPYFYKHMSGEETLKFYGKLCGLKGKLLKERIEEMLQLVSLEGARHRRLGGYSKGMLQRIGIAQALIQKPRLVILDEPTAGVDPVGSRQIRDMILRLKQEGITVFLCSHLLEQVQEICDTVGIMFGGKIVQEGQLEDLIAIDDQTEIILEGVSDEKLDQVKALLEGQGDQVVRMGRPKKSLENLFIEHAEEQSK